MATVVPLIGKAFAAVGSTFGVAGAGAATAGAGIISSVAGGIMNYQSGRYQAAVAMRMAAQEEENAKLEERNAAQAREAGGREAQMQDIEALAQMSDEIATQGASGFSLSSGSFVRRRTRLDNLATRDRTRIVEDSNRQGEGAANRATSARNRAWSYRAEGRSAKKGLFSTLLDVGLGINKSLISGANLNSEAISNQVNNTARAI